MKAYAIDRYRGPLSPRTFPDPVPGQGDVIVVIAATSVNPLDCKLREGAFKLVLPYKMPLILGNDLAGTVVAVGPGVRRFKIGDEVFARPDKGRIGTFAERIAIAEVDLALKPTNLSMAEAASPVRAAFYSHQFKLAELGGALVWGVDTKGSTARSILQRAGSGTGN